MAGEDDMKSFPGMIPEDELKQTVVPDENIIRLANSFLHHMEEDKPTIKNGKKILTVATIIPIGKRYIDVRGPRHYIRWEPDSDTSLTKEMRLSIVYQYGLRSIVEYDHTESARVGLNTIFALLECIRLGFNGTLYLDGKPSKKTTIYLELDA
jgi:hypothetical protein